MERELARLTEVVAADVAAEGRPSARLVVKVRCAPFETRAHGLALAQPTADPAVLDLAARAALDGFARH